MTHEANLTQSRASAQISSSPPHSHSTISSRYALKGLDTSPAMLEFFSGKHAVGPGACFQHIDRPPGFGAKQTTRSVFESTCEVTSAVTVSNRRIHEEKNENANIVFNWKKGNLKEEKANFGDEGPEYLNGEQQVEPNENVQAPCANGHDYEEKSGNEERKRVNEALAVEWDEETEETPGSETGRSSDRSSRSSRDRLLLNEPGPEHYEECSRERYEEMGTEETQGEADEEDGRETEASCEHDSGSAESERSAQGMPAAAAAAILIKGAQIVNDDSIFNADVFIEDKVITQVSTSLEAPSGAVVIEGNGKLLIPAGIDVHTDFSCAECADDFDVGSRAALAGGTATVIDVVVARPGESLLAAYERVRKAAESKSLCNFGLSVVISSWNDVVKKEMELIVKDKGVNSFIIDLHSDDHIFQALELCKTLGAYARILPENKNIISLLEKKMLALGVTGPEGFLQSRPEALEAEYVERAAVLSQLTNCPVSVMSVSSAEARDAVLRSRSNSLVFPEVSVVALASDGTHYFNKCIKHAAAHLTPCPLRLDPRTPSLLLECVANSALCVCVSDHRGFRDRAGGDFTKMPVGVAAAEERMAVVWEKAVYPGRIDPMRFVAVTSSNAAKLFNLYPKKGRIAVGADADVVLWDPSIKRKLSVKTQQSHSEFSVFESVLVHGAPVLTVCGARIAFRDGKFDSEAGRFVNMASHSPYLFCVVQQRERVQTPEKVEREESGSAQRAPTAWRDAADSRPFHSTAARSQFESNFSVTGAQSDDARGTRASTKVLNPPGGRSSGFW